MNIVNMVGVPPAPWKTSTKAVGRDANDPLGGTNVNMAKRTFVSVRMVGGRDRRNIRIAMVSPKGQD